MKTVIYLDILLLVNFLCAYFLLLAAGTLSAQRASFGRMLLSSCLAALCALILFAPQLPFPAQLAYKLGTAAAIVAAAYGCRGIRRYLTAIFWYAALNLLLAGLAVLFILKNESPLVQTGNLTVYLRISPLLLLGLSGLCCLGVELARRFMAQPKPASSIVGVQLELCGQVVRLRAALDTGCHLKDPITCLPVLLVSYPDARARLPREARSFLDDWFGGQRRSEPPPGARLRVIPCTTATERGLLPGFAVGGIDLITTEGPQELGRSAIAFSPQEFGSEEYEALYGPEFL